MVLRPVLLLALICAVPARAGTVVIDGELWRALQPPEEPKPVPGPGPRAVRRDVVLEPVADGVRVRVRWRVHADEPGWLDARLAGPAVRIERVTWRGGPVAVASQADGHHLTVWVDRDGEVELEAVVLGDPTRAPLPIELLAAAAGRVDVRGTTLDPRIEGAVRGRDAFWTGEGTLALQLLDEAPVAARTTLAVAQVGMGLTVGDAELEGRARVQWQVRQGALERVSFRTVGLGADVRVTGSDISSWQRVGDRIEVELRQPEKHLVTLEVAWSDAVPAGDEARLVLPVILPDDAWRTETVVQLARDGEVEVVPELQGVEAAASSTLPSWAGGLVVGTPTASYRAKGAPSGSLSLLRFQPVEQPAAVVDIASYTVATNADGHLLGRAHFTIRNERASHLRVIPPPGTKLLALQVGGQPVVPGRDDGPGWLVPLVRSVETVEGLLSFPVEVIVIGEVGAWDAREQRLLELVRVDAPVAVSRLTLYLPPGYESRLDVGEEQVVADFTEGETITYGYAVGDVAVAQVDLAFQDAVGAWMRNDFDEAQAQLDKLREMGAETENVRRLQSNLDVIDGKDANGDDAMARRVKDQARARAVDEEREQEEELKKAEEAYNAGDYASASSSYGKALEIGEKLDKLEQSEAVEVDVRNVVASSGMLQAKEAEKSKQKVAPSRSTATTSPATGSEATEATGAFDTDIASGEYRVEITKQQITILEDTVLEGSVALDDSEYLQNIPAGRTFESVVQTVPGVVTSGDSGGEAYWQDEDGAPDEPEEEPVPVAAPEPKPAPDAPDVDRMAYATEDVEVLALRRRGISLPRLPAPDPPPPPVDADQLRRDVHGAYKAGLLVQSEVELEPAQQACVQGHLASLRALDGVAAAAQTTLSSAGIDAATADHERAKLSLAATKAAEAFAALEACTLSDSFAGASTVETAYIVDGRGPGSAGRSRGERGRAYGAKAPAATTIDVMSDEEAPPAVYAAAMTVLVPAIGEAVRYQQLLLPSDATFAVEVRAISKDPRRNR